MKSKDPRNVEISQCIALLSNVKNDFITDCFINLAKWDFRNKFLKWFLDVKVDKSTEKGEEKEAELKESIMQVEHVTKDLIDFITLGNECVLEELDKKIASLNKFPKKKNNLISSKKSKIDTMKFLKTGRAAV